MRPTGAELARMTDAEFRRFLRGSGFVARPGWSSRFRLALTVVAEAAVLIGVLAVGFVYLWLLAPAAPK